MFTRAPLLRATISLLIALSIALTVTLAGATVAPNSVSAAHNKSNHVPARCKSTIKSKGSLTFSDWQFPANLNPSTNGQLVAAYVENAMFEGLFVYDQNSRNIPQMTTVVPTFKNGGLKDGGRTVTVHLKHGLRWSNGAEIVSGDIKFGLAVGRDPLSGPFCAGTCDVISRIDTPDKYTAVVHTKGIYAPILAYGLPPIFPRTWNAGGFKWSNAHDAAQVIYQTPTFTYENAQYPTNGAYQVKEFVNDDRIVLTPMKYYTNEHCGSYLKQLIFSFYSSKPGLIAAAAAKQTDVTGGGGGYTPADLTELRKHTDSYQLHATASLTLEHLEFNVDPQYSGKANPLSNAKVRLALALATDKIGLIRSALGVSAKDARGVAAWSVFVASPSLKQPFADSKVNGQWDPIAKRYIATTGSGKALADAKKLLSQTAYKGGFSLDFVTTTGNPVRDAQAAVLQQNWKRLNVDINIQRIPSSTIFGQWSESGTLHHGMFQVGMFGQSGSPDPDQFKYNLETRFIDRGVTSHTALNQNYSGVRDTVMDKAFTKAAGSLIPSVRSKNYAFIQEHVNQQAYWIGLYYRPTISTTSTRVVGFKDNPTQEGPSWNIYDWKTKAS